MHWIAAWDETKFIAGYPGKYAVVARRHGDKWYVAGLNGTDQVMNFVSSQVVGTLFRKSISC